MSDPFSHGAPVPPLVLWRWLAKRLQQLILLRCGQQLSAGPYLMPLVLDAVGAALVVAPGDPADPVCRVSRHTGNYFGRVSTGQEPKEMPAAALDRILRAPVASCEFVNAQVRFEVDVSCHASRSTSLGRDAVSGDGESSATQAIRWTPAGVAWVWSTSLRWNPLAIPFGGVARLAASLAKRRVLGYTGCVSRKGLQCGVHVPPEAPRMGGPGLQSWPACCLYDEGRRRAMTNPTPLPGDLRVAHLVGPDIGPHLAGRWQFQVYDDLTGSWRALVGKDLSGRPAYWRAEPTFASEAEALDFLRDLIQRSQR